MGRTIKERTLEFINYLGIKMVDFERQCDLSSGYVTSMRKGFGEDKLNNVLKAYPNLNREWLLYGEGNMLNTSSKEHSSTEIQEEETGKLIPLLPVAAQGGSFNDFVTSIRARDCEFVVSPIPSAEYAVPVVGDSMYPEYPNGSIVFVKRINESAFIEWGRVFVLDTCNGIVIKQLFPSDDDEKLVCKSINEKFPPFEVRKSDIYRVFRALMCMSFK